MRSIPRVLSSSIAVLVLCACGAGASPAAPPPCDQSCQDGVALRGTREAMKLAFNLLVQAHPVGAQDSHGDCRSSNGASHGSVRVFGDATSNAVQGSSFVDLEYDFVDCAYSVPPSVTPEQNYGLVFTGHVRQKGTIAVQPSSTTALVIESESLSLSGTVYDPPVDYAADACALSITQQGSQVSGTLCGRNAGFTF